MRKNLKRCISLVLCILIATAGITCYWSGTAVASDGKRTVKVAFFPMQGYNDIDENGKVTGMDVEYLEEVCKSAQRIYLRHAGSPG